MKKESYYQQWREEITKSTKSFHKQMKRKALTDITGRIYLSDGLWMNADGSIDDEKDG